MAVNQLMQLKKDAPLKVDTYQVQCNGDAGDIRVCFYVTDFVTKHETDGQRRHCHSCTAMVSPCSLRPTQLFRADQCMSTRTDNVSTKKQFVSCSDLIRIRNSKYMCTTRSLLLQLKASKTLQCLAQYTKRITRKPAMEASVSNNCCSFMSTRDLSPKSNCFRQCKGA